eukprot:13680801-Ditylum_brightwellii.AAC.1
MRAYSIEEVKSRFSYKTLTWFEGEPSYDQVHTMMMELYPTTVLVPTTLEGGAHGHIGLVMDATLYSTLSTMHRHHQSNLQEGYCLEDLP